MECPTHRTPVQSGVDEESHGASRPMGGQEGRKEVFVEREGADIRCVLRRFRGSFISCFSSPVSSLPGSSPWLLLQRPRPGSRASCRRLPPGWYGDTSPKTRGRPAARSWPGSQPRLAHSRSVLFGWRVAIKAVEVHFCLGVRVSVCGTSLLSSELYKCFACTYVHCLIVGINLLLCASLIPCLL